MRIACKYRTKKAAAMSATTLPPLPFQPRPAGKACNCEQFAITEGGSTGVAMPISATAQHRLGTAPLGFCGRIRLIDATGCSNALPARELERRLLEMGFVEGAVVEIRNQGLFGHDPIAVRVNNATVALRRAEANAIHVDALDAAR
jgi:ferrous iron transport protein A